MISTESRSMKFKRALAAMLGFCVAAIGIKTLCSLGDRLQFNDSFYLLPITWLLVLIAGGTGHARLKSLQRWQHSILAVVAIALGVAEACVGVKLLSREACAQEALRCERVWERRSEELPGGRRRILFVNEWTVPDFCVIETSWAFGPLRIVQSRAFIDPPCAVNTSPAIAAAGFTVSLRPLWTSTREYRIASIEQARPIATRRIRLHCRERALDCQRLIEDGGVYSNGFRLFGYTDRLGIIGAAVVSIDANGASELSTMPDP